MILVDGITQHAAPGLRYKHWSHMVSTVSADELHQMADRLGLRTPNGCNECRIKIEERERSTTPITTPRTDPLLSIARSHVSGNIEQMRSQPTGINVSAAMNLESNSSRSTISTETGPDIDNRYPLEGILPISGSSDVTGHRGSESSATTATCRSVSTGTARIKSNKWCWFQRDSFNHYDITPPKRAMAIGFGAREVSSRAILFCNYDYANRRKVRPCEDCAQKMAQLAISPSDPQFLDGCVRCDLSLYLPKDA